jgi:hypothetical protein
VDDLARCSQPAKAKSINPSARTFILRGGEPNAFEVPVILDTHPSAFEKVEQSRKRFAFVPGTGRNSTYQVTERHFVPIDFSVWVFHGCQGIA